MLRVGLATMFCSLCIPGILCADVEFRAAWQGQYVSMDSANMPTHASTTNTPKVGKPAESMQYEISINDCKENLCTFTLSQLPLKRDSRKSPTNGRKIFHTTLRLLDYTKAEMPDHNCQLEALDMYDPALQIPIRMRARACKIDSTNAPDIAELLSGERESLVESTKSNTESSDKSSRIWQRVRVYPSFDCKKARTNNERTICGSSSMAIPLFDIVLNDMYALLLESKDHKQIRAEQQLWLKNLAKCDGDESCLQEHYRARILELEERYCQECE